LNLIVKKYKNYQLNIKINLNKLKNNFNKKIILYKLFKKKMIKLYIKNNNKSIILEIWLNKKYIKFNNIKKKFIIFKSKNLIQMINNLINLIITQNMI
jgi:hypothetical protein